MRGKKCEKISEDYLNKLLIEHTVNDGKLKDLVLAYNTRDNHNPNIIVWKAIYLTNINGKIDFQMRQHKLRWFESSVFKELLHKSGFNIEAIRSGPQKKRFNENIDTDMWLVATKKQTKGTAWLTLKSL